MLYRLAIGYKNINGGRSYSEEVFCDEEVARKYYLKEASDNGTFLVKLYTASFENGVLENKELILESDKLTPGE